MKKIFCLCLLFCSVFLWAEVGVLSVTDEDVHAKKEDFWHTFEYYVTGADGVRAKCQATRVGKKWFATAAHCVEERCKGQCSLQVDLLEQPYSALASVEHTDKKPVVFIHPEYDSKVPVVHDFALIKMDVASVPLQYYRRAQGEKTQNVLVSKAVFDAFLRRTPVARREFEQALRPKLPALLIFGGENARIDRQLSVISIFNGQRQILQDPYPADYIKQLGFAYTKDFGIREGVSGSGIMTNTGELAGIAAAHLSFIPPDQDRKVFFMFSVFDGDITAFMENVMGSDYYKLDRRDASDGYVSSNVSDYREIVEAVEKVTRYKQHKK